MKKPSRPRTGGGLRKAPAIAVIVEEPLWRKDASVLRLIRRAARLALTAPHPDPLSQRGKGGKGRGFTVLLTDDARLRALNAAFRGKDRPTNVLSFPATSGDGSSLGDIAIAYGVVAREARAQGKSFAAHAAHLAAHGILHLLGYDHEKASEAKVMEALERTILAKLSIADPYAPRPYTGRRKAA